MNNFSQVKQHVDLVRAGQPWFKNPPKIGDKIPCETARYGTSIVTKVQISEEYEANLRGEVKRSLVEIYSIS
ncbi:MAG: hypothetical protein GXP03_14050 [Alphaproteobacteria bacterium]|nr:hypothetical protein [Alphaproteobacteria bacterium]